MSQLINQPVHTPQLFRKKPGVLHVTRHMLKIDMTPMVDLGFLLISFFVITTELSRPTGMNLLMPHDGMPLDLPESAALTVLLDHHSIYYYQGKWEESLIHNTIIKTDFSDKGLRKIIMDKQQRLQHLNIKNGGSNEMMLLIKPSSDVSYTQVVAALNEAAINRVKKYALIKITPEESRWLTIKQE